MISEAPVKFSKKQQEGLCQSADMYDMFTLSSTLFTFY